MNMMKVKVARPRNCGECARMQRFKAEFDGEHYDGACPEFCTHVKSTWVCNPNVGWVRKVVKNGK